MEIDEFKNAAGKFPTGVCVITTSHEGNLFGFTANSFTSVSLRPSLVSFCLDKKSYSLNGFTNADHFVINILASDQAGMSDRFARSSRDKFAGINYKLNQYNIPILPETISVLECQKYQQIDCGDHVIFVGEVQQVTANDNKEPLIYYGKKYREIK